MKNPSDSETPHNLDAERAVLGSMLIDATAIPLVRAILAVADFYSTPHQKIFAAIEHLADAGLPVDLVTLSEELRVSGELEDLGGLAYISSLEHHVLTTANVACHARIVAEKAAERRRRAILEEVLHDYTTGQRDWSEIESDLAALFQTAQPQNGRGGYVNLEKYLAMRPDFPVLPSLWCDGVLKGGTINLLSAGTGLGKSIFVTQLAMCMAAGLPFLARQTTRATVVYVQTELADSEQLSRIQDQMLAQLIPSLDAQQHADLLARFVVRHHSADFHLWSNQRENHAGRYLQELETTIKELSPGLVVLDPLADILRFSEIDNGEIAAAMTVLKTLAERHGTAFLLVGHWSKAAYGIPKTNLAQAQRGGTKIRDTMSAAMDLVEVPNPTGERRVELAFSKLRYRPALASLVLKPPCETCLFFEVDATARPHTTAAGKPKTGQAELRQALEFNQALKHADLVGELMQRTGCSQRTARMRIEEAAQVGQIRLENGQYVLA